MRAKATCPDEACALGLAASEIGLAWTAKVA